MQGLRQGHAGLSHALAEHVVSLLSQGHPRPQRRQAQGLAQRDVLTQSLPLLRPALPPHQQQRSAGTAAAAC